MKKCPYCGGDCEAEFVDVGFGGGPEYGVQVTPYVCLDCGATEIGPYDESKELTEQENKTGFYEPQRWEEE